MAVSEPIGRAMAEPGIERFPFGGGVLVHNPATGTLGLLNRMENDILWLLQVGLSDASVAARLATSKDIAPELTAEGIAARRASWMQAGLLTAPEHSRSREATAAAPTPPELSFAMDITISCGGPALRLRCEEPPLAALLAEVLRPALSRVAPQAGTLDLTGADGDYQCWSDGRLIWSCGPWPLARRNTLREVLVRTVPEPPVAALLHASTVAAEGRAVVLAGDTGSGKSTLAADLVGDGAQLIADDLTPLLPDGRVQPVPLALSLKEGSWPLLTRFFPAVDRLPVLEGRHPKVLYLWPGAECTAINPLQPTAIVFPTHVAGAHTTRANMSPRECLQQLITTDTQLEAAPGALGVQVPGALAALARFAEETPAFALTYERLEDGSAAVRTLLRDI
jgi:hypothetical protein